MNILLFPPIAFMLIFIFVYILYKLITPPPSYSAISASPKASKVDVMEIYNYRKFFSYAAFFMVLHVAGLMLATWAFNPLIETIGPVMAYLISVAVILAVFLYKLDNKVIRKESPRNKDLRKQ